MKIGMFDSGVGGLTVLSSFLKKIPNVEYIYVGDTKRVPYGGKSHDTILQFCHEIIHFLLSKQVDIIVIACNTASALCLEDLESVYQIPIIGVVLPTIEYVNNLKLKSIGVIGTSSTIKSQIYETKLIDKNVMSRACPIFVPMIEEDIKRPDILELMIDYYLADIKGSIDALILGCTHYPIIESKIATYLKVPMINPADITADYVKKHFQIVETDHKIAFYFTDVNQSVITITNRLINSEVKIQKLDL